MHDNAQLLPAGPGSIAATTTTSWTFKPHVRVQRELHPAAIARREVGARGRGSLVLEDSRRTRLARSWPTLRALYGVHVGPTPARRLLFMGGRELAQERARSGVNERLARLGTLLEQPQHARGSRRWCETSNRRYRDEAVAVWELDSDPAGVSGGSSPTTADANVCSRSARASRRSGVAERGCSCSVAKPVAGPASLRIASGLPRAGRWPLRRSNHRLDRSTGGSEHGQPSGGSRPSRSLGTGQPVVGRG